MTKISADLFTEKDVPGFLEMSQLEYGPSASTNEDHIKWKHLSSPFGASTYISLSDAKGVFGRVLVQPRPLITARRVLEVASVMDMLIDSKYRKSPINFINLAKASGDIASFDLVYHTSNERTLPLYSKLLRFNTPFSLRAYAFPVRFAGLFSLVTRQRIDAVDLMTIPWRWLWVGISAIVNKVAKINISNQVISDVELEVLCAKCVNESGPLLARPSKFLKWRFENAPLWPATVSRVDRDGQFLGYVVTRKMELGGLVYLVLMDFIIDPAMPLIARLALQLWLIQKAVSSRVDMLFTMINPFNTTARKLVRCPFIMIPDKFLPHASPIFVRARNNIYKELEADRTMHLTLADMDYF